MNTHAGSTFVHSCITMPIDPCNNCPAPTYNRSRIYLGRRNNMENPVKTTANTTETDEAVSWLNQGIKSLAKLYDSIPDYSAIHHLSEEEFYSTLDTLRSTCRQLKSKPPNITLSSANVTLDASSTATSTNTPVNPSSHRKSSKKSKSTKGTKNSKSVKSNSKDSSKKSKEPTRIEFTPTVSSTLGLYDNLTAARLQLKKPPTPWRQRLHHHFKIEEHCFTEEPTPSEYTAYNTTTTDCRNTIAGKNKQKFKTDYEAEVEAFKRKLKEFEDEIKNRPISSTTASSCLNADAKHNQKIASISTQVEEKPSQLKASIDSVFRKSMRKAFSVNDIDALSDLDKQESSQTPDKVQGKQRFEKLTDAEALAFKDRNRASNYFEKKCDEQIENSSPCDGLPRIVVDSPNTEAATTTSSSNRSNRLSGKRKKKSRKKDSSEMKMPFTLFNLVSNATKKDSQESCEPRATPVHPAARPNLAATLRMEVSKKKLKELKNNCTYHDSTPQFDWEVRKTPAWKSLAMNESHKEILALRLETRRAEQALLQREYELNMELMRQRVKSAPLLLEGNTYWGPNVGKLTHNCQYEGMRHTCHQDIQPHKPRKKSTGRREGLNECRSVNRLNTIRKIYASSAKCSSRSRSSSVACHRSNSQARVVKEQQPVSSLRKHHSTHLIPDRGRLSQKSHQDQQCDSADDLSSVDRAFL